MLMLARWCFGGRWPSTASVGENLRFARGEVVEPFIAVSLEPELGLEVDDGVGERDAGLSAVGSAAAVAAELEASRMR